MNRPLVVAVVCFAGLAVVAPLQADWGIVSGGPSGIKPAATAVYRDAVYVGTFGGVARYDGSSWQRLYPDGYSVQHMLVYNDRLYVQTTHDVYRYDGSVWESVGPGIDDAIEAFDIDVTTGRLYFATDETVYFRDAGGPVTSIPYSGWWIAQEGLAVHAGVVVVRDWDGTLNYYSGGSWHQVSSSLDFWGVDQVYYGPRGLFVSNSSQKMPIDLDTGQPTADAHECYRYAEVQSSENKQEVFISGDDDASERPAIVGSDGSWTYPDDPRLDRHVLLTSDGSTHYLAGADYLAVLGTDSSRIEVGSSAPFPFFKEIVTSGDNVVALGAYTVWLRRAGGPWQALRRQYSGYSLAPGAHGDVWVAGYGYGEHSDEDFLHILADGTIEGEGMYWGYQGAVRGSDPIVVYNGTLYAGNDDGLWRREGREDWVLRVDWSDSVATVYNYWGSDPPIVYYSPATGAWSVGFIVRDNDHERQVLYVEPDTGWWYLLPKPAGWHYPVRGTVWDGELHVIFANYSPNESAVFRLHDATLEWQELSDDGLPTYFLMNDLVPTPEGLVVLGIANQAFTSFGSYRYGNGRWSREGRSGHAWGPGMGEYFPLRQTIYSIGYSSGPLLRHGLADIIADFTWQPLGPAAGQEVRFDDLSIGDVSSRQWSFGDGSTSSVTDPTHVYYSAGTYTVALTATGPAGSSTASASMTVGAGGEPPVASFTFAPQEPNVGEQVQFTDTSTGGPTAWVWDFGDGTTSTAQNPSHAYRVFGTYTVSLTASNTFGSDTATRSLVACCEPGEGTTIYIPAAANNPGDEGTSWNTDAELSNRGPQQVSYEVHLLRTGQGNSDPDVAGPFTLAAGTGVRHEDVVQTLFGVQTSGALRFMVDEGSGSAANTLITSRTYNDAASGTYGQYIPGVVEGGLIPPGQTVRLIQLSENDAFRTNLGLLNGTDSELTVFIRYGSADGSVLGEESITLQAYEHRQFRAFTRTTQDAVDDGFVDLWTDTAAGLFYGYASVVDNQSGDPVYVEPAAEILAGEAVYLPAVANNPGDEGTSWRTDAELSNRGSQPVSYGVHLLRTGQGNSDPDVAGPFTLAGDTGVRHEDIVENLFGVQTSGALRFVVDEATKTTATTLITSRTYNDAASGTYGQYIPGVAEGGLIPSGQTARLIQLSENDAFRTNLGLLNGTDAPLTVSVRYGAADGTLLAEESITLQPYEHRQFRAFTRATQDAVDDGYVDLWTDTAGGLFYGYASVVDNLSGDPVCVRPL